MNFLASPPVVTAMAFSGKLSFNPITDSIPLPSGKPFKFEAPSKQDLPDAGFTPGNTGYYPTPCPLPDPDTKVIIRPDSQRLEELKPFPSHFGEASGNKRGLELPPLQVLMRVRGKCTTDHISAVGPWLKYKGHLTNISENLRKPLVLAPVLINCSRLPYSHNRQYTTAWTSLDCNDRFSGRQR